MKPVCENCDCWNLLDGEEDGAKEPGPEAQLGECRHGPPQVDPDGDQFTEAGRYGVFPLTLSSDWCRQFRPSEQFPKG